VFVIDLVIIAGKSIINCCQLNKIVRVDYFKKLGG